MHVLLTKAQLLGGFDGGINTRSHLSRSVRFVSVNKRVNNMESYRDTCACGNVLPDKKVQWADNLEEVRYFVPPNSLRKGFKKKMTKIRRKASEITDKPLRVITSMGELSVNAVQNGLEFILRHGQSGSFDAERVTYEDLIKEWDKLFEINSGSEETTDDDEDENSK